ncbi:MAG: glycosyltransferase family 4 protein [Myxococcota bacterium]
MLRREVPSSAEAPLCVVYAETLVEHDLALRTRRALAAGGLRVLDCSKSSLADARVAGLRGPLWFVRAGAWPTRRLAIADRFPSASSTRLPLCALGAVVAEFGESGREPAVAAWSALLHASGGDLSDLFAKKRRDELPELASVYLDEELSARVVPLLAANLSLSEALRHQAGQRRLRLIRYAALDVHSHERLRVAQVVTSLQRGGAERLTLDLASELAHWDVSSRIYSIYSPTREPFPAPARSLDLAKLVPPSSSRDARFDVLVQELAADGTDLVHAHLLDASDLERLSARGYRSLVTVHNTQPGFPVGLAQLDRAHVSLLVGCARAVEDDLAAGQLRTPLRTIWNGIRVSGSPSERRQKRNSSHLRSQLGLAPADVLLLALANPRPQKRLHLLPSILAATRAALAVERREVKLVVAGAASPHNELACAADAQLRAEVERCGMAAHVYFAGLVRDVAELLDASDVLVSPSEHEGLSLAHLEALAHGVPVVASGAGGTGEVAEETPALRHLSLSSTPAEWASAIIELSSPAYSGALTARDVVARHFSVSRMAESYARLYPRALARTREPVRPDGVVLITNNFSMGGAQSSARRLLLGLRDAGIRARAIVIEEQPEYPTPGCRALRDAGIVVQALPPPTDLEPARAVARILDGIERDPPQAVILWNVIAEHKLLIADGLLDVPLFDVSPGEMYFRSLERYFAMTRRPGLPYRTAREYGARLSGVIVKYQAEAALAASTLGAPVHVISNGVPLGAARPAARRVGERLVIGTSVRIHPDKKLGELLAALRLAAPALPPHVLRIAGGIDARGEEEALALRRAAADLHVEWLGELADLREFLDTLDIFVLVAEPAGCPNASLEAMAGGLPLIATDVGGMGEQVVDGVSGRLVPRGDAEAFARALVELASRPELRVEFGRKSRERAEQRFSLERMVTDYAAVCLSGTTHTAHEQQFTNLVLGMPHSAS